MVRVKLDYDQKGLNLNIDKKKITKIFSMKNVPPLKNPVNEIKKALNNPIGTVSLRKLIKPNNSVCVVVSDKTRPVPNKIILPPLLELFNEIGLSKDSITILIGTGAHSPTIEEDLIELLGKEIVKNYRVINHNARDEKSLVYLGKILKKVPVYVNKIYYESDFKIVTGFIEPHFMAGFSGGRKGICPGICGLETIKYFHSPFVLESKYATPGVLKRNPCDKIATLIAEKAKIDFLINVTLNFKKQITGVFCGDYKKAFLKGVEFCKKSVSDFINKPLDVVITSGGGYPLDRNFYQTVKGIVGAVDVVKKGGTIIIASGCRDGIGSKEFRKLLQEMKSPEQFLKMISKKNYFCMDQWEVEELIKGLKKARIKIYTDGLSKEEIKICHIEPINNIEEFIRELSDNIKIGIIPNGPYILTKCINS